MHDRDDIELALMALEEGWSARAAGELAGVSRETARGWRRGRVSHERCGTRATLAARDPTDREAAPMTDEERAAYETAMTENMLPRAVLDNLKAAGSRPASISNGRKAELGERLRAATGLPLREITAFLRISRSSYEYHRARLGDDGTSGAQADYEAALKERDERIAALEGETAAAAKAAEGTEN